MRARPAGHVEPGVSRWTFHRRRLGFGLGALVATIAALVVIERVVSAMSPFPQHLVDQLAQSRRVYSAEGTVLRILGTGAGERVIPVPLHEISPHLVRALVFAEDERFYAHRGVDVLAAGRALAQNVSRGRVVSGASTLTMQVVRILMPDRPRSLWFKLVQMFRARQLERRLSKAEVLEIYCSHVPLGGALRGFEAAALRWFGVRARDLTLAQAATLVVMLPAPGRRAPHRRPRLLTTLRDSLLARMRDAGSLSGAAYVAAVGAPLGARRHDWPLRAAHASDYFLQAGHRPAMVTDLEWSLQQRLERIAATHGGVGDGVAIVVLDRSSAAIRAMVGAASYGTSQLNAATSRRCLGSTLKPFLYAQAIQLGVIGPRSLVDDSPLQLGDFRPANFERGFAGSMDAAEALATSRNLPAIRLLQAVGCERFAELLWRLGLPVDHRALQLDAALGTAVASPLELAQAYQRFVTADVGLSSHAVEAVVAALSTRPLGTGAAAGAVAWKTGTSSGRRDAWSVGITGACVAVVWVGNLSGRGDPTLTGNAAASGLLARVVAAL